MLCWVAGLHSSPILSFSFLVVEIGVVGCCVCDGRAGVSVFVHGQILSQVLAISCGAWGILKLINFPNNTTKFLL